MDETVVFTVQLVYIRGELSTRAHFKSELEADERVTTATQRRHRDGNGSHRVANKKKHT